MGKSHMLGSSLSSGPLLVSQGNQHPRAGPSGDLVANFLLGNKGLHSALPAHPTRGPSLQVPEGVPHRAVPALCATQMHPASALHLLPLALREPATTTLHPPSGRHVQLQPRRLLHQVRRGHRPLPGGRRVSDPTQPALRGAPCLLGRLPSECRGCFWGRPPQPGPPC